MLKGNGDAMANGSSVSSGDFALQRRALLDALRKNRLISERSLRAMDRVPREAFVNPEMRDRAYDDVALPISEGQTISQPTVVGMMTSALEVRPGSHILEIGTGSGYQAAVLARMGGKSVISVELVESLAERARKVLDSLEIKNVEVHHSDGSLGWPSGAPYDRIIVTAAAPAVPRSLLDQLSEANGSRLVVPVGEQDGQRLVALERQNGEIIEHPISEVRFVPLRGEAGWHDDDWEEGWKADWDA